MRILETKDVTELRPLYAEWLRQSNSEDFKIKTDSDCLERDFQAVINTDKGAVLVAYDDNGNPIGVYSQLIVDSCFGAEMMAIGTHWFSLSNEIHVGHKLLRAAKKRAHKMGCSNMLISASKFASDDYDSICKYCEHIGAKQFETIYLLEV